MVVVKVFKSQSLLPYTFERSYRSEHLLALTDSTGRKVFPYKSFLAALNPNSRLAPLCLAAATALSRDSAGRYPCSQ